MAGRSQRERENRGRGAKPMTTGEPKRLGVARRDGRTMDAGRSHYREENHVVWAKPHIEGEPNREGEANSLRRTKTGGRNQIGSGNQKAGM